MAAEAVKYEVELNETALLTYGRGSTAGTYWMLRREMWEYSGRLRIISADAFGDTLAIDGFDLEDAEFFRDHLVEKGAPKTAFKIRKVTS